MVLNSFSYKNIQITSYFGISIHEIKFGQNVMHFLPIKYFGENVLYIPHEIRCNSCWNIFVILKYYDNLYLVLKDDWCLIKLHESMMAEIDIYVSLYHQLLEKISHEIYVNRVYYCIHCIWALKILDLFNMLFSSSQLDSGRKQMVRWRNWIWSIEW